MTSPDQNHPDDALKEKLEELESLLDSGEVENRARKIEVPVLDELVTEADFINSEDENNVEQIEEQIVDLAEKLEHKFSGELDQLVRLLKNNLKNSIVEELRHQANLDQNESSQEDEINNDTDTDIQKNVHFESEIRVHFFVIFANSVSNIEKSVTLR